MAGEVTDKRLKVEGITVKEYDFTVVAHSPRDLNGDSICDIAEALFSAGAEDCTVASKGNQVFISFDRQGKSYTQAVMSALAQIRRSTRLEIHGVSEGFDATVLDAAGS